MRANEVLSSRAGGHRGSVMSDSLRSFEEPGALRTGLILLAWIGFSVYLVCLSLVPDYSE
jgi:hypothetical protein